MKNSYKQIAGDFSNKNISIIGLDQDKKDFIDNQFFKDYFCLSINNLKDLAIDDKLFQDLNLSDTKKYNSQEYKIIANVFDIIRSGIKNILFDDLLMYIDKELKDKLIEYLKNEKINFINITADMEEVLYSEYLVVIYNGMVALEGETVKVLSEEKILKRLGFNLPFIVDLSIQLNYYGLVDKIYLTQEELVSELWK